MLRLRPLLCCAWLAWAAPILADEVIDTQQEFDAWLASNPAPLEALTPGARQRFISSVSFGPGGITAFDASDLMDELSDVQIRAVLAPFGPRALDNAPPSHYLETRRVEKNVRDRGVIGPIEQRYNEFYAQARAVRDAPDLERSAQLAQRFDTQLAGMFEPMALRRADDHELRILRAAARRVAMATLQPRHVDAFRSVFRERVRRALVSSDDAATLYGLSLAMRRHAEARRLRVDYPLARLPAVPVFLDAIAAGGTSPTAWRLEPDGRKLARESVDLGGTWIVVTVDCDLSREAAGAIAADPLLGPVFEKRGRWIALPPGLEDVPAASDWNREFPRLPVTMIYDRAEWRMLPDWRATQFHVVRDGREVEKLDGWDGVRSRAELIALLERHALLTPEKRE
jgi:hypothetical protein